ncbi:MULTISPECIES: TetR/AcrR family transcriptional regulator [Nocardia]|uniref:TetR/AcrR family transcriptional regulator n=1 Tax=Nocardia TaxID=1817 RepID=UPI00265B19BA|nr:TetR/AcrR family transcriptional regulator [Nocardia sp. PE-7]WKG08800.1 TetR/AcrR family transcriptional regulator [Nocardia sp. PE-7]
MLSEELIVETCLRLVELHGAEALSMRRLGAALGADATAVYRYFRNKHDLLLAITDTLTGRGFENFEPSGDWLADLRQLADSFYQTSLAHPEAAILTLFRVTGGVHEIEAVETILGILRGAGFDDADAVRYYHALSDTVISHSLMAASWAALEPAQVEAETATWRTIYRSADALRYPNVAATGAHLASIQTSAFHTTLDLILQGIAAARPAPG